ncbi:MAG TPA: methylenetetrahydrofolate reductase [Methylomusa anaerophila]|uniref:Methylenetetrahydrofolate reductase n=1 Tax=Methylomusa anaerophila TaxID=1930071 RepID=A0A348AFI3_9FIRM|nr:methylenetetrahydrofolate reductase [Methylomusa anaerophila]BBB89831.1 bifunctional homocysteine S-methyltransferase/5,10-methylenetetrahydrofolate reductase [Methylomusa anaerophila]HML89123.1 methylenetetrahydrofolate reductase [Methylomusa anaerophila]
MSEAAALRAPSLKTESKLEQLYAQGHFIVTGELGPPQHSDGHDLEHHAHELKDIVDAFNLTDNQTAIVRLSSIAAGVHVLKGGGVPIIQMTCRDRNRIAMQSDLLGAYSLGICDVLCLSGDHQSFGNHPTGKNVYDVDSIQLISMVKKMRDDKQFLSSAPIKAHEPRFFIGAVENPFGDPFEFRVTRLEKKINAGADFIQTQAIFDLEKFARFMEMAVARGLHQRAKITAGILPVRALRALQYMQNDVAGMEIPDSIIQRMKKAVEGKDKAEAKAAGEKEGIQIAIEMCNELKKIPGVAGIHIMPVGWEAALPEIVKGAGFLPRPKA